MGRELERMPSGPRHEAGGPIRTARPDPGSRQAQTVTPRRRASVTASVRVLTVSFPRIEDT